MNERITFISVFDKENLEKIEVYTKCFTEKLCKVPFGKKVGNRKNVDTLPYHFTISAWNICDEEKVKEQLSSKIKFPKLNVTVDSVQIMSGKENSYVLYFNIRSNEELKSLQKEIYQILPSGNYSPDKDFKFHITIHIDKNYNNILKIREAILDNFTPFDLEVDCYGLYEIYPALLISTFKSEENAQ